MFERISLEQLTEHVWLMDDAHEATGYVVIGEEKAAVIDTMNGHEDVLAVVRTLTDKPVTVINTHGHCDHIFGNIFFDSAYLHPDDLALAGEHGSFPEFLEECEKLGLRMPPFLPVHDGDVFDLGGLHLQAVHLPGHTRGGILLILREERILFTGDTVNRHCWMQLDTSLPLREFLRNLERCAWVKQYADRILHGHARGFEPIRLYDDMTQGVRDLIAANGEGDRPYKWFGGEDRQHEFAPESVICYARSKLENGI